MSNLEKIRAALEPFSARLVAVSKTQPNAAISELFGKGQRLFGENRPQELASKMAALPSDIDWHFIGHLQSNKVKMVVEKVGLIHSVDSKKILQTIDSEAFKSSRTVDCLLQFHIADEATKQGFAEAEAVDFLASEDFKKLQNVRIVGVMGMATYSDDREKVRAEFRSLRQIFERLREQFFAEKPFFRELSMGMSGDFDLALEEGATLVRIGSALFGEREKPVPNSLGGAETEPSVFAASRQATEADFAFFYRLYMTPGINEWLLYEWMPEADFWPIFRDLMAKKSLFVLQNEKGQPAGMFKMTRLEHRTSHLAYLGGVAIAPEFAGQKMGEKLIAEVLRIAREQGIRRVELSTATENFRALRLYEKMGFEREGILRGYTHLASEGRTIDEVLMSILL